MKIISFLTTFLLLGAASASNLRPLTNEVEGVPGARVDGIEMRGLKGPDGLQVLGGDLFDQGLLSTAVEFAQNNYNPTWTQTAIGLAGTAVNNIFQCGSYTLEGTMFLTLNETIFDVANYESSFGQTLFEAFDGLLQNTTVPVDQLGCVLTSNGISYVGDGATNVGPPQTLQIYFDWIITLSDVAGAAAGSCCNPPEEILHIVFRAIGFNSYVSLINTAGSAGTDQQSLFLQSVIFAAYTCERDCNCCNIDIAV